MIESQETSQVVISHREPVETRLLSLGAVEKMTGLSRSTLWRMQRRGELPKPVQLSQRRVAYRAADIETWLEGLRETNQ